MAFAVPGIDHEMVKAVVDSAVIDILAALAGRAVKNVDIIVVESEQSDGCTLSGSGADGNFGRIDYGGTIRWSADHYSGR